jgi:hypothetical protein
MNVGAQPQNLEFYAVTVTPAGLDALAKRMLVLEAVAPDGLGEEAAKIVHRDLETVDVLERADGPFGQLKAQHFP